MIKMNRVFIVAEKEIKELISNRIIIMLGVFFVGWFSVINAIAISKSEYIVAAIFLNNTIFYISLLLGFFLGYMFSGQIFLREKYEGVIVNLLCTPLNLRTLWFGKVIGVTIPSYLLSILSSVLLIIISNIRSPYFLFPSVAIILHVLFVVPIFIAFTVGLVGFAQFLFGMRENRIIYMFVYVLLFGALAFTQRIVGKNFVFSWIEVGISFTVSVVLLSLLIYLISSW